jgi:apolipoprotein N-acyltransferase
VECRKPSLIAAYTGFSAWIDSDGRILVQGRRRETDVIVARPQIDRRASPYLLWGDWPAALCLLATAGVAGAGFVNAWRGRRSAARASQNT